MRKIIYTLLGLLCFSCASDLHFDLPRGPEGPPGAAGKSAYEVWVEAVKEKTVEWSGTSGLDDFFRYLKGRDGEDGASAYALWCEQVASGIDNPHCPGTHWDRSQTTLVHFFQYLTGPAGRDGIDGINGKDGKNGPIGADGLSAYELWLDLLEIPGAVEWDGGTTLIEFFRYLKGKDGKNGENGLDGLPGSNGLDGERGADGRSAYELWAADVAAGTIEWPGTTTYADFWLYLKGETGETGQDGANGLSAYELWLFDIARGAVLWTGELTLQGFWKYLEGAEGQPGQDGASAYELWVLLVAEGIPDPHNAGAEWPAERITITDFYAYLTGPIGPQGPPGTPGETGPQGPPGADGGTTLLNFMEGLIEAYYTWVADVEARRTPISWPKGSTAFDKFLEYCRLDNSYLIPPQP